MTETVFAAMEAYNEPGLASISVLVGMMLSGGLTSTLIDALAADFADYLLGLTVLP